MKDYLQREFRNRYHRQADSLFFSPGRVNLIGEHIDYNGGLVFPCAITMGTYLVVRKNHDGKFRFSSLNFADEAEIAVKPSYKKEGEAWYNYPLGIINQFTERGKQLAGLDMLFYGNLPIGSGLSSSASIEVAMAFALNELFNCGFSKLDLVKMSKATENNFIGVNSGIMDQFAVAFGKKDTALLLDCATLKYDEVNCELGDYVLAIINTNKPRKLAESKYNERVAECNTALKGLQQQLSIINLCDISPETFERNRGLIDDVLIEKRAAHVIEENARVKHAAAALSKNDLLAFGQLMYESHESLRDLYEVSGLELDTIVDYCKTDENVAGARMTGAGFGGCAIALVQFEHFETFKENITEYYLDKIGYAPDVYQSFIGAGVGELDSLPLEVSDH